MKKRVLVLLTAIVVALAMTAGPVFAGGGHGGGHDGKDDGGKGKVCVKHFTGSKKNPHNYILIPKKAFHKGHKKHGDYIVAKKFCEKKKDDHHHHGDDDHHGDKR